MNSQLNPDDDTCSRGGGSTFERTVAVYYEICPTYQAAQRGKKSSAARVDGFDTTEINV